MAEDRQILLDRKILSLDFDKLREFALHVKVEKSAVEGKGKLSVIRAVRHMIEDSVDSLAGDDQIEYIDGLMAFLGPPPLEGMEEQYGNDEKKPDLEQVKQELVNLESKQKLVEEKLSTIQKGKVNDPGEGGDTVKVPLVGVQQSILRRDFKIQGVVGDPGQKDKLGYQALISQIEAGLTKGYTEKEVVSAVIRAVQPGLQLRSYLENMTELTLAKLRKILRFHFHEKNATELYQLLTNIAQQPKEDPQSFLMRALTIRQKIISASKESDSGIKYDASSVQSLFLHAVETGLADETIRAKIRPLTRDPNVADEDLIGAVSLAISAEMERSNKFSLVNKPKTTKVCTVENVTEGNGRKEQQRDQQLLATLKAVQADLAAVQSEVKTLRETATVQSANTARTYVSSRASTGVRQLGCKECKGRGQGDECPHCYFCGGLNHIARFCQKKFAIRSQQGNEHRLPPRDRE